MSLDHGCGTTFYGRRRYVTNRELEEYDSTKWFCLLWFPVIPLGSFRIRRAHRADAISRLARVLCWSEDIGIVHKRPFDLRQILTTWAWAVCGTVVGLIVFGFLMFLFLP